MAAFAEFLRVLVVNMGAAPWGRGDATVRGGGEPPHGGDSRPRPTPALQVANRAWWAGVFEIGTVRRMIIAWPPGLGASLSLGHRQNDRWKGSPGGLEAETPTPRPPC